MKKFVWRTEADIERYNDIAREVMESHNVRVNDLHQLIMDHNIEECIDAKDGTHLTAQGINLVAQQVSEIISEYASITPDAA